MRACVLAAAMRAALDAQVRYQQAVKAREQSEDVEWLRREQDRIKIWNAEERKKTEETKAKNNAIREQREQQLRELSALRTRERAEQAAYDREVLASIKREIQMERAKEALKRESDAENLRIVAIQNIKHLETLKLAKEKENEEMRALEAQWSEVLDKQERARDRQLKMTYSRQAKQYGTAASMQEEMERIARDDEARANRHAAELEVAAAKRDYDQTATRARLQREMLDVLSIQVREKTNRAQADQVRDQMVLRREHEDLALAEQADVKQRAEQKRRNERYREELVAQMTVQEERRVLEPFLMTKAERQMNAALLRRLPQ